MESSHDNYYSSLHGQGEDAIVLAWTLREEAELKLAKRLLELFDAATESSDEIKAALQRENEQQKNRFIEHVKQRLSEAGLPVRLAKVCWLDDVNVADDLWSQLGFPEEAVKWFIEEFRPRLLPEWNALKLNDAELDGLILLERGKRFRGFLAEIPKKWKRRLHDLPQTLGSNLLSQVIDKQCSIEQMIKRLAGEAQLLPQLKKLRKNLGDAFKPEPRPSGSYDALPLNAEPDCQRLSRAKQEPEAADEVDLQSRIEPVVNGALLEQPTEAPDGSDRDTERDVDEREAELDATVTRLDNECNEAKAEGDDVAQSLLTPRTQKATTSLDEFKRLFEQIVAVDHALFELGTWNPGTKRLTLPRAKWDEARQKRAALTKLIEECGEQCIRAASALAVSDSGQFANTVSSAIDAVIRGGLRELENLKPTIFGDRVEIPPIDDKHSRKPTLQEKLPGRFLQVNKVRRLLDVPALKTLSVNLGNTVTPQNDAGTRDKTRRRKSGKRRGKPNVTPEEAAKRKTAITNWRRAKAVGKSRQQFCENETALGRNIDPKTLNQYVNWDTQKRTRKALDRG